jgi:hypothetical protein
MNKGLFATQINTVWDILRALELAEYRNYYPNYSAITISKVKNLSYLDAWRLFYINKAFNFQLGACCLLQFRMLKKNKKLYLNYVYYECPYDIISYKEFIENEIRADYNQVKDIFINEYEDYVQSCDIKETVTPIRYDLNIDNFEEGVHPVSHVHIGHENDLRLGAVKIWKPLSFALFIIRQCHKEAWRELINMSKANIWSRNIRQNLDNSPNFFESEIDKRQVILT